MNTDAVSAVTVPRVRRPADPLLAQRIISAVILVPLVIANIWLGGWAFRFLVILCAVLLAYEYGRMLTRAPRYGTRFAAFVGVSIAVGFAVVASHGPAAGFWLPVLSAVTAFAIGARIVGDRVRAFTGVLYIGVPALAVVWLRDLPDQGLLALLSVLVCVWLTDTASYFTGRRFGVARLAPRLSPNKTWAGFWGGLAAGPVALAFIAAVDGHGVLLLAALTGLVLALAGQGGDLFESWLKRGCGTKDSGRLIPGHGGLLDRLDSLMFAAPTMVVLCLVFGGGALPWR